MRNREGFVVEEVEWKIIKQNTSEVEELELPVSGMHVLSHCNVT